MARLVANPPNPWHSTHVEYLEDPPKAMLEVFEENAKSIIAENDSPDVGFRFSVNPYRGCVHGCAYCYARPRHQMLGFGAGTDFERKIVVKVNAPELLERAFQRPSWRGELIAFSGDTDCYQPLEASYELTRRCLEVCAMYRNPVAVITKSQVIRRDVELLARLSREARANVTISIPFADEATARKMEPWASSPEKRFAAMRELAGAGVRTGIALAPVVPGLNDADIPELLERAKDAGAQYAFLILLRLPNEVLPVFQERVRDAFSPELVAKIEHAVQEMRGGRMYDGRYGLRQVGRGDRWRTIEALFELSCRRLGLNVEEMEPREATTFRRPSRQMDLFG